MPDTLTPEQLAILFHDTYERLAPSFGYETRADTRQFDPTTPNGRLMIAVCAALLSHIEPQAWRPISEAPLGKKIIAGYYNSHGKWRTILARFYEPGTLEAEDTEDADENGFAPMGWYEEGEAYSENLRRCDQIPTRWQPLPSAPAKDPAP